MGEENLKVVHGSNSTGHTIPGKAHELFGETYKTMYNIKVGLCFMDKEIKKKIVTTVIGPKQVWYSCVVAASLKEKHYEAERMQRIATKNGPRTFEYYI